MLNSIASVALLTPGVIEILNKKPDIDMNNNIVYIYPKVIYVKIDNGNLLPELKKTNLYKISKPISESKMQNFVKQIN